MNEVQKPAVDPVQKRKRWGVRTLMFLILATLCILVAMVQGHYTILTSVGVLIGLSGGAVCTVRGLLDLSRS